MISPRGLILPQLPMGWGYGFKKAQKKPLPTRALFEIEDTQTGQKEVLSSSQIEKKYGLSKHLVSGGARDKRLVAEKYRIKKVKTILNKYVLLDEQKNTRKTLTVREITHEISVSESRVYSAFKTQSLIQKRYRILSDGTQRT